jgi:predicted Rossmann-fold nucleotide-binding protein
MYMTDKDNGAISGIDSFRETRRKLIKETSSVIFFDGSVGTALEFELALEFGKHIYPATWSGKNAVSFFNKLKKEKYLERYMKPEFINLLAKKKPVTPERFVKGIMGDTNA